MRWLIIGTLLLAGCASSPTEPRAITVHDRVAVLPPATLLEPCASPDSDGTVGGELKRLSQLAQCQRDKATAIQAWAAVVNVPGSAPAQPFGAPPAH